MALVVNSNISSINAQRQMLNTGAALDQASERLASGKRINSAGDDAAGLAIANRQTSQIRGLDQAIRNANDGVAMIQTAEGALDESTNILQRMRELSVQSSNGTYSDTDRATLNAETEQLKSELDRIAETTSFNGQKILDGSQGEISLQVGAQSGETIDFEIPGFDTKSLGGENGADIVGGEVANDMAGSTLAGDITVNGVTIAAADLNAATTNDEFLDVLNTGLSGAEASLKTEMTAGADGTGIITGGASLHLDLAKSDGTTVNFEISGTGNMQELADKINEVAGGEIQASLDDDGRLVMSSDTGASISVDATTDAAGAAAAGFAADTTQHAQLVLEDTSEDKGGITLEYATAADAAVLGIDARVTEGEVTGQAITDGAGIGLTEGELEINGISIGAADGDTVADNMDAINAMSDQTGVVAKDGGSGASGITLVSVDGSEISIKQGDVAGADISTSVGFQENQAMDSVGNSVSDVDISTAAGASEAIDIIDDALEQVNNARSEMGAVNNRLDFTVSNLSNVSEKTSAARSQIMDADFAKESANLSKAQVLQQASQAMLAQANSRPQQVLSLLG